MKRTIVLSALFCSPLLVTAAAQQPAAQPAQQTAPAPQAAPEAQTAPAPHSTTGHGRHHRSRHHAKRHHHKH